MNKYIKEAHNVYVSYLNRGRTFDKDMICTDLISGSVSKPKHAWWGSPINAEFGWKEWCQMEHYGNYDFEKPIKWKLKEGSKILTIDDNIIAEAPNFLLDCINTIDEKWEIRNLTPEDIKYLKAKTDCTKFCYFELNFFKLREKGIDAVELMDAGIGHAFLSPLEMLFNSWDCESIVVLDDSKIEFL